MRHWKWPAFLLSLVVCNVTLALWWAQSEARHTTQPSAGMSESALEKQAHAEWQPDRMLDRLWALNDQAARRSEPHGTLLGTMEILEPLDTPQILALLRHSDALQPEGRRPRLRRILMAQLMRLDPAAALEEALALQPAEADELLGPLFKEWLQQHPRDAEDWLAKAKRQHPGEWKTLTELVTRANAPQPPASPETPEDWMRELSKADAVPDEGMRSAERRTVLIRWAEDDWKAFHAWIIAHPGPEADTCLQHAVQNVVAPCVRGEGEHRPLADFMATWEPMMITADRIQTGVSAISAWALQEPVEASEWLRSRAGAPWRDAAASGLAIAVVPDDPEAALHWAQSIADEGRRNYTLVKCCETWRTLEPARADAWVSAHLQDFPGMAKRAEEWPKSAHPATDPWIGGMDWSLPQLPVRSGEPGK